MFDLADLLSHNLLPIWTVLVAVLGAAVGIGVHRQQLKSLLGDMSEARSKLDQMELKITQVEADVLRNYVATTTLDKALEPITRNLMVLHDELKELRAIFLRKFG